MNDRNQAPQLAGWWSRAGAVLLDGFILLPIIIAARLLVLDRTGWQGTYASTNELVISGLVGLAIGLVYFPLSLRYAGGRTVGMRAFGIRVVARGHGSISLPTAVLREISRLGIVCVGVALPGGLGFVFIAASVGDYLWPLRDQRNRALHDLVAGTLVISGESGGHAPVAVGGG